MCHKERFCDSSVNSINQSIKIDSTLVYSPLFINRILKQALQMKAYDERRLIA